MSHGKETCRQVSDHLPFMCRLSPVLSIYIQTRFVQNLLSEKGIIVLAYYSFSCPNATSVPLHATSLDYCSLLQNDSLDVFSSYFSADLSLRYRPYSKNLDSNAWSVTLVSLIMMYTGQLDLSELLWHFVFHFSHQSEVEWVCLHFLSNIFTKGDIFFYFSPSWLESGEKIPNYYNKHVYILS